MPVKKLDEFEKDLKTKQANYYRDIFFRLIKKTKIFLFSLLKPSKQKIVITLFLLLSVSFGFWLWLGQADTSLIGQDAVLRRVVFGGEKSENAYLSLSYTADSQKYLFVNVVVDLNKDGKFADYQINGNTQKEWVVQNVSTRVFAGEGVNYDFQLTDLGVDSQKNFPVQMILTKKSIKAWQGNKLRGSAHQTTNVTSIETDDIRSRFSPSPEIGGKTGFWGDLSTPVFAQDQTSISSPPINGEDLQKELEEQTKNAILKRLNPLNGSPAPTPTEPTVATLGKEFDVFNSDIPDITQGKSECAPTSIANSMLWLAKKKNFSDKMPKTQAELINELKGDLKWGIDHGVYDEDLITGKKAFAARHNIPIEVHRVAAKDYDTNIVAKIAQELQKGQDVEIGIEYWKKQADGKWKVVGGHWVTAVGARGTRDGNQTIDIHDPASPGPSSLDSYKVDDTKIINYRYRGDAIAFIQYAVAESPVTPPTTPPSDSSTPTEPTTKTPTFETKYQKYVTDNITQFSVVVKPLDLAGKTIIGMDIDLMARGYTLPPVNSTSVNLNDAGWYKADWQCRTTGNVLRCLGQDTLREGKYSVVGLNFSASIDTPPPFLNIKLLGPNGATVVGVGVEFKPNE